MSISDQLLGTLPPILTAGAVMRISDSAFEDTCGKRCRAKRKASPKKRKTAKATKITRKRKKNR